MTRPANSSLISGLLVLVALNAAVFWPVLSFDFVRWDDDINITQNTLLTDPWSGALVARLFDANHALRFKPLHWLALRGAHFVAGFDPTAWHALNLALHVTAAGLLFVVLRHVLTRVGPKATAFSVSPNLAAFFAAAVWSLHPLRAEAVAWATASTYPLSAVCLLASFAAYLNAHRNHGSRLWLFTSWLFAVFAYASYPVTATYGLWLIATDKWLLPQAGSPAAPAARLNWRKHAWFVAPAVLAVGLTLWSRFAHPGIFTAAPAVESVGVGVRLAMALASLTYLAARLILPVHLTPNVPPLNATGVTPAMLSLALLAVGVLVLAWRLRHTRPRLTLCVLGFAAISLPCLGLTERPTWPVDRYTYVAHLVLLGAVAVWWARAPVFAGRPFLFITAATALSAGLAVAGRAQSLIWRDSRTLFTHMERHPSFAKSARQQGHIYILWARDEAAHGRTKEAERLFQRAREVYVGAMSRAVGAQDYTEALSLLTHVERHFGVTPELRREKAAWLLREHRVAEAKVELQAISASMAGDPRLQALLAEADSAVTGPQPAAERVIRR